MAKKAIDYETKWGKEHGELEGTKCVQLKKEMGLCTFYGDDIYIVLYASSTVHVEPKYLNISV